VSALTRRRADAAQPARERLNYYHAIEKELTRETWRVVRAYGRRCALVLRKAGVVADGDQLAVDALSDTALGKRRWQPGSCPLGSHLCGVIDSRMKNASRKEGRKRHIRVDWHGGGEEALGVDLFTQGGGNPEDALIRKDLAERFTGLLFDAVRAKNDRILLAMMERWADGATSREDIAAELGITPKQYKHARERLARIVEKLSEHLRTEAQELMREIA
jgi:hypothetical protein